MTIAEVSKNFHLSPDTLRYYERIGLIPPVHRNSSGFRDYTETDCRRIEFIICMRSAGLPLEVLIEYMQLYMQGDETIPARKEILIHQRDKLAQRIADMQKPLDRLNQKISIYDERLLRREHELLG